MKLYLIDDDRNIINILKLIIRDRGLGELCGTASCGVDALDDFTEIHPDIVIVDLLMPEMDGIALVKQARPLLPNTAFIMLSQVSSKDMISQAYENGVEFYIQKPINSIEVESVIKAVSSSITAQRTLKQVQSIFSSQTGAAAPVHSASLPDREPAEKPHITKLKTILQRLGIIGEKGSRDIITLVDYLIEHNEHMEDIMRLEQAVDEKERELQQAHVDRLTKNECTPEAGMLYSDVVSGLERIADHATNIVLYLNNVEA